MSSSRKKVCSRCKISKYKNQFGNDSRNPDGKRYECNDCRKKARVLKRRETRAELVTSDQISELIKDMVPMATNCNLLRENLQHLNYLIDRLELEQQANSTNSFKLEFGELGLDSYDEVQIKAVVSSILINLRKNPSTDDIKTIDLQDGSFLAVITNAEFSKADHKFIKEYTQELQKM